MGDVSRKHEEQSKVSPQPGSAQEMEASLILSNFVVSRLAIVEVLRQLLLGGTFAPLLPFYSY